MDYIIFPLVLSTALSKSQEPSQTLKAHPKSKATMSQRHFSTDLNKKHKMSIKFSDHALSQLKSRKIPKKQVVLTVKNPEQKDQKFQKSSFATKTI